MHDVRPPRSEQFVSAVRPSPYKSRRDKAPRVGTEWSSQAAGLATWDSARCAAFVLTSRASQGLPPRVTDAQTLFRVAQLLGATDTTMLNAGPVKSGESTLPRAS